MKDQLLELADAIMEELAEQGCYLDHEEALIMAEMEIMYGKANHYGVEQVH